MAGHGVGGTGERVAGSGKWGVGAMAGTLRIAGNCRVRAGAGKYGSERSAGSYRMLPRGTRPPRGIGPFGMPAIGPLLIAARRFEYSLT